MYVLVVCDVHLGAFYLGEKGDLVSDVSKARYFPSRGLAIAFGRFLVRTTPSLEWFDYEYVDTIKYKGE